jgi:hypothetical protein
MNREEMEREIREHWFKDHKATLTNQGDLQVLDWSKTDTCIYGIRYVFDGCRMYITGDLGEALFVLTWRATLKSFEGLSLSYFEEKMRAFSDERREFNSTYAVERLREWLKQMKDDEVEWDNEEMRELFRAARQCTSISEWVDIVKDSEDFVEELDVDYWEWMYNAGNQIPIRVQAYLIGLKMAYEQLKENQNLHD